MTNVLSLGSLSRNVCFNYYISNLRIHDILFNILFSLFICHLVSITLTTYSLFTNLTTLKTKCNSYFVHQGDKVANFKDYHSLEFSHYLVFKLQVCLEFKQFITHKSIKKELKIMKVTYCQNYCKITSFYIQKQQLYLVYRK